MRETLGKGWRHFHHLEQFIDPLGFPRACQPAIEFQRAAKDILDSLARVQRRVGHLIDKLDTPQLVARARRQIWRHRLSVKFQIAGAWRQQPGEDARQCGLPASGFADDANGLAAFDGDIDVAKHHCCRRAVRPLAIAGIDIACHQCRCIAHMLMIAGLTKPGFGKGLDRRHQTLGIGMLRFVDDRLDRAGFLDLAIIENDDMVGDLRHHRKVMRHIDGRRALFLDHLLEGFQHLDLGGHVKRRRWLVKHQQVGLAAQRHGRHQPLQLTA